jgi:hypothetical protein
LKNVTCSFCMFIHVVAIKTSFFFNQYFNWFKFWIWYDVEVALNSFSISSVKMIDFRRTFFIDQLKNFALIDAINYLFFETIFSRIMILLQMIYTNTTRIYAWFDLLDWFKITSRIFLQMIDRKLNNDKIWKFCIDFE